LPLLIRWLLQTRSYTVAPYAPLPSLNGLTSYAEMVTRTCCSHFERD
jgi:hypothetical protein